MPSYPLTFPATPKFRSFSIREKYASPTTESPFTNDQQVFEYSGSNKIEWEMELVPIPNGDSDIDTWIQFLRDLHGKYGTFTLNLQTHSSTIDYVSGQTGLPTTWRSKDNSHGWTFDEQRMFTGVTLRAIEA